MLNKEGEYHLRAGIIHQAVKDYREALKKLKRKGYINRDCELVDPEYEIEPPWLVKLECERFFQSDWFGFLSDEVDGQIIIDRVRDEVMR